MLNVIKNRNIYYSISGFLTVLSLLFIFVFPLNLWIDMTWWTQTEYTYSNLEVEAVRANVDKVKDTFTLSWSEIINNIDVYKITWENKIAIVAWFHTSIVDTELENIKVDFKNKTLASLKQLDPTVLETQYISIWKSFWDYIKNTAISTLIITVLWIALYLAWAFSWILSWWGIILSFSSIVILSLFHDVIVAVWFYVFTSNFLPDFKIDTFFVTALLTILWYSINDTIVIFDRIRANLKLNTKKNKKDLDEIINISINETFARSIYTSLTVIMVLVAILIFWPVTIKWFVLTMLYGTLIWTYSSIFIAAPMLYDFNKGKAIELYEKKEYNSDDKIVV
jgi:preprotein translocase SecF subunit